MSKDNTLSFHRRLIRQGLETAWGHKHVWLFGFFAAFTGLGGALEPIIRVYDRSLAMFPSVPGEALGAGFLPGLQGIRLLVSISPSPWLALTIYALIALLALAILAFLAVMGLGAAMSGLKAIHQGKDLDFPESLKEAGRTFWSLFGTAAVVKLSGLAAMMLVGFSLLGVRAGGFPNGFLHLLSFVIFAGVAVVVAMVGMYAVAAAVDSRLEVREAIRRGFRAFSRNWLVSLEAAVLILLTQLVLVLLAVGAGAIAMVPVFLLMFAALYYNLLWLGMAIAVAAAVVVVLTMCLLAAFLTTFQLSVWWQLWLEFGRESRLQAGLERWVYPLLRRLKSGIANR